ncbi:amp dependent CoA ligase [Mycena alexandri]|uniref:Amp dependent CoA ligase n=1 Tax=Mycena alexandri TaxID=1745969 RepID=A0AAD6ST64_9AGAR|nr:amp dependent CoA ligase [Mycena alexandri]
MPEFHSDRTLPHIPDDVTLEQFILGYRHEARPRRPDFAPWLVADKTGRQIRLEEIQQRVTGLANGLHTHFGIRTLFITCGSRLFLKEYPICIWAIHRLCAIVSPCNPTITTAELTHQLLQTRATSIIAHPDVRDLALASAGEAGIPPSHVIFFGSEDIESADRAPDLSTVTGLTSYGLSLDSAALGRGRRLREGEGRTKIAFLSSSTKTTGKPKARISIILSISHFSVVANVVQVATHCRVNEAYTSWEERRYRPGDVCLAVLPFYHIYGLAIVIHFVLFSGMTLVVAPKFDLEDMLKSIVRYKISQLMLLPPQVALLCKEPIERDYDLSGVHSILSGAAPLAADVTERLISMLPKAHIGQAYGSTESTGIVSMWSTRTKRGYNAGELVPGIVARVVKPDGALAEHDEAGELLVKTPSIALGYLNDEDTTNEAFVDGWLHTGDQVTINQKNEIIYIDRLNEIIKVRGFEVAPADLEACILGHKLVQDVAVIAINNKLGGTAPLAFVVLIAKASASCKGDPKNIRKIKNSIMTHVAERKSSYKQLHGVELVDEIPKDLSGKILRRVLQDQLGIPTAKL